MDLKPFLKCSPRKVKSLKTSCECTYLGIPRAVNTREHRIGAWGCILTRCPSRRQAPHVAVQQIATGESGRKRVQGLESTYFCNYAAQIVPLAGWNLEMIEDLSVSLIRRGAIKLAVSWRVIHNFSLWVRVPYPPTLFSVCIRPLLKKLQNKDTCNDY